MSGWTGAGLARVASFARDRSTSSLVIVQNGETVLEEHWLPDAPILGCELLADGRTREDVASVQKSVTSLLVGAAVERGLLDIDATVSSYVGPRWSRAASDVESVITLRDLLTMTSGLDDHMSVAAPPRSRWFYNLGAAYHTVKRVLAASAGKPINELSRAWLFDPLGLNETEWVERPVSPDTPDGLRDYSCYPDGTPFEALVTSARDLARLGGAVLAAVVSGDAGPLNAVYLKDALRPATPLNPAYGLLWWLNGQPWHLPPRVDERVQGWLIPDAPADLVGMLGAHGRSVHIVPSLGLVVVRMGADPGDNPLAASRFGRELWARLRAEGPGWETAE